MRKSKKNQIVDPQLIYDLIACPDNTKVCYTHSGVAAENWEIYDKEGSVIVIHSNHVFQYIMNANNILEGMDETRTIEIFRSDIDYIPYSNTNYKKVKKEIAFWIKRKLEGWDKNE